MQVSEIMTADPDTCTAQDTVQTVARQMAQGDYGSMPVVEGDRLVGVVTDRDIAIRAVAEGRGPDTKVGDVMTSDPVCVSPDTDVEDAADVMMDEQIRRLFVTDEDDRLVGVVALADIALEEDDDLSGETLEEISED